MTEYTCVNRNCVDCDKPKAVDCCIDRLNGVFPAYINIINTVEWLRQTYHFVTLLPTEDLYMYNDGCYIKCGESFAYAVLEKTFGSLRNVKNVGVLNERTKGAIVRKLKHQTYKESYIQLSPYKIPYFDRDLDIINMCNGLYNWRTGEFKPHTSDYPSQIQIAVEYNPNADCPNLREIIKDVLKPSDITRFYEAFAYSFYRDYVMQMFFLLLGEAGTGKSQLLDMLQNVIGSWNISHVTIQDLGGYRANRFAPIKMFGKLLNIAGDLDSTFIPETGKIKMLCSGVDEISGEKKYMQDEFNFVNFAKTWYSANKLPEVNEESDGFYRRVCMFLCDNKFDISDGKSDRLESIKDPKELSGLFNEAIQYLPKLLERKRFTGQLSIDEVKSIYKRSSNTVEEFLNNCIESCVDRNIPKKTLYEAYIAYCDEHKLARVGNKYTFGRELRKVDPTIKDGFCLVGSERPHCWQNRCFKSK